MNKEVIIKVLFAASLSIVGWGLQKQIFSNSNQENRIIVMEESKADKEVVQELQVQIGRQTEILQTQSVLLKQQHDLLKIVLQK